MKKVILKFAALFITVCCMATGFYFFSFKNSDMKGRTIIVDSNAEQSAEENDSALDTEWVSGLHILAADSENNYDDVIKLENDGDLIIFGKNKLYECNYSHKNSLNTKKIIMDFKKDKVLKFSRNGNKILYLNEKNQLYIYDLKNKKHINVNYEKYNEDSVIRFLNDEGSFFVIYNFNNKEVGIVNINEGSFTKLPQEYLLTNILHIDSNNNFYYTKGDKNINLIKTNIDDFSKAEILLENVNICELDELKDGNSIIFNGDFKAETGIFIYEFDKKTISKVVSGGKDSEGQWCPFYSLSPDKRKLAYEIVTEPGKSNIYVAKLIGSRLRGKNLLLEKAELGAVISLRLNWEDDSKGLLIKNIAENNKINGIDIFKMRGK